MKQIRIWERNGGMPKLITADEGELRFFDKWTSLKLYNGKIYQADKRDPTKGYVVGRFVEDEVILDISSTLGTDHKTSARPRNMSIKEVRAGLKKYRAELKSPKTRLETKRYIRKYLISEYLVEFYKKFSIPFACLALGVIGVPVGLMVRKGGRMIGLGVGVGIITMYYVVLTAGEKAAKVGVYPPSLGAWTPNIITLVVGIILVIRTIRETPLRSSKLIDKLFPSGNHYGNNSGINTR